MKFFLITLASCLVVGCATRATPPTAYDFVVADAARRDNESLSTPQPSSASTRAQARVDVAVAQFEIGNYDRALAVSEEAISLDGKNLNARLVLALTKERLHFSTMDVRGSYESILSINPQFYDGLHNYGIFLCENNSPAEGFPLLQRAMRLKSGAERTLLAASQCAPDTEERVSLSKQAIELQPTWTEAWLSLSNAYSIQKKWTLAHQSLQRYFYLEPQPTAASYRQAYAIAVATGDLFHQTVYTQKLQDLSAVATHLKTTPP